MMNETPMRYGLFGVGRCGCVHGQILIAQGQQIVALGDENESALSAAVRKLGLPKAAVFKDAAAMSRYDQLDAVVIASHTKDHARDALPFVQAGIPVYLEKPLTADLQDAFAFVKQIGLQENLLQIGLQRRFDAPLRHAKALLEAKLVGEIREIRSVLRDQFPPPPTYTSRGLIIDMGIHVADEALWLTGEFPNRVWAKMFTAKSYESPIDEGGNTAHVGFTTPSGVIGRLDLSRTHAAGYNNETSIIGTHGVLNIGRFSGYPGPVPVELWTNKGTLHPLSKTFPMAELPSGYAEFQPRFQQAYETAHAEFQMAVRTGRSFAATQRDVLNAQVMAEAAHLSAVNGGIDYPLAQAVDLAEYERICERHGLLVGQAESKT
jgi:myo-inositol 2-dehydrogenase / D-chiro-inositol 1-dehydrogenase